jgi:prophage regulatory protein
MPKLRKFLRIGDVRDLTGLATSTIYDGVSKGTFPAPVKLTEKSVGWLEDDLASWMQQRIAARDAALKKAAAKKARVAQLVKG